MNMQAAIHLNNEAVSFLVAGQEDRALGHLQRAVAVVKKILARHVRTAGKQDDDSSISSTDSCASSAADLCHDSLPLSGLSDPECFIYNRAIRVRFHEHEVTKEPAIQECSAQLLSAIIIFNMALVLHRVCLMKNVSSCAEKPQALYKIVLNLLNSKSCRTHNKHELAWGLKLASLNNLSQLQFEQGDYPTATRGFDLLSSVLSCDRDSRTSTFFAPCEIRGIAMNILCLKMGATIAPAA
jgi:hypothetical protein